MWALSTNPNGLGCSKDLGTYASASGPNEKFINTDNELVNTMIYLLYTRQNQ